MATPGTSREPTAATLMAAIARLNDEVQSLRHLVYAIGRDLDGLSRWTMERRDKS